MKVTIAEATAAAILASAIMTTAGGVFWMVVTLPSNIEKLNKNVTEIKTTVNAMEGRFNTLERRVDRHEDRIERLEE